MKLIIDINEEDFEIMKHNIRVDNPLCPINQKDMVIKIANGTPLDKIRAEMVKQAEEWKSYNPDSVAYENIANGLYRAVNVIDKYRKESKNGN